MNHITFEVGDRVRHKLTQIQGEIVQMEQSLAMPHAWVIEPSVCEINPPKLYRLIDLEKVDHSGSGAQKTNQAQGVNPNLSCSNQSAQADGSTSKEFQGESVLTVENDTTTVSTKLESQDLTVEHETITVSTTDQLQDLTVENETVTVSTELESLVLTVESLDLTVENQTTTVRSKDHSGVLTVASLDLTVSHLATTVSTELESLDLTVENEAITVSTKFESLDLTVENEATLCSESVLSEQIASKPIPITVKSSSNTTSNTSTSNEFLSQQDLTVEDDSTTVRSKDQLQDLTVENQTTTVSTKNHWTVLTVENQTTTVSTEPESFVLTVENDTTEGVSDSKTQRSNKRRKGKGTGRIQLRTITKQNGKQYQQFWYDWQVHTPEKTIYKSVYIPKRLLKKIQALESAKAPVSEILEVLGVVRK